MEERKELKAGALLSYILLVINAAYGLITVPFILGYVGEVTYGVYKTISSLSTSLSVIDFGLGTTMTRYIARFKAEKDDNGARNFIAMLYIEMAIIIFILICIAFAFFVNLDSIYANTFSAEDLKLAKGLFTFLIVNMALTLFENLLFGIINGNGHFTFANATKVINLVAKFAMLFVFLPLTRNVYVLVVSHTVTLTITIIVFYIYIRKKIGIRPKLIKWDNSIFKESFTYTFLMFVQNIVIQFNGNVDNILIGSMISSTAVTVYSMSLVVYMMYENMATSISNLMLPRMTRKVVQGVPTKDLQNDVERAGRFQYFVLAAALGGFAVLGKDFYLLWVGKGFEDCFLITLLLMFVTTFPVVQNVSLSILRAQNKMVYRTVTLVISCTVNIALTIIGIRLWGYFGAAAGTAIAKCLNCVFMNIYYKKKLGFRIGKMFYNIMFKTTICAVVPTAVVYVLHRFLNGSWISFIFSAAVFIGIYIAMLMVFGFKDDEKRIIFGKLANRIKRKG